MAADIQTYKSHGIMPRFHLDENSKQKKTRLELFDRVDLGFGRQHLMTQRITNGKMTQRLLG